MNANLTPRQKRALEVLARTGQVTTAAQAANVSRETVYDWLRQPHFKTQLCQAEAAALDALSRSLVALGEKATAALEQVLQDRAAPPTARISAARTVLENLLQLRKLVDLEERVSSLEEKSL